MKDSPPGSTRQPQSQPQLQPQPQARALLCCIVDDHCDTVPFLHALWKAKRIQFDGLALLHVDSHPDLVVPACSVTKMHDKALLYSLLEECGGISEFILPLVVNGHFSQGVTWLHQEWAQQIPLGRTTFLIGDHKEEMKGVEGGEGDDTAGVGCSGVSSVCSYYLDEGLSYRRDELSHGVEMTLLSCHDDYFEQNNSTCIESVEDDNDGCGHHHSSSGGSVEKTDDSSNAWILDICLDYFTVTNPYLEEVRAAWQQHDEKSFSSFPLLLRTITSMFHAARFRAYPFLEENQSLCSAESYARIDCDSGDCGEYTLAQSRRERDQFLALVTQLLDTEDQCSSGDSYAECTNRRQFLALFDGVSSSASSSDQSRGQEGQEHPAVMFLQLLPTVPQEVKKVISNIGVTMLATLPHHVSSWAEVQAIMSRLETFLQAWTAAKGGRGPEAICIARSDGDGFTDSAMVDATQALLLTTLRKIAADTWLPFALSSAGGGGCSDVGTEKEVEVIEVHDLREDPFLAASALFHATVIQKYTSNSSISSSSNSNGSAVQREDRSCGDDCSSLEDVLVADSSISSCSRNQPAKKQKCK